MFISLWLCLSLIEYKLIVLQVKKKNKNNPKCTKKLINAYIYLVTFDPHEDNPSEKDKNILSADWLVFLSPFSQNRCF